MILVQVALIPPRRARDSSTRRFMETIYVRLLGEGTEVYRPVPAKRLYASVFLIEGKDIHDPEDEEWEFLPGARVFAVTRNLGGGSVLVATRPA